MPQFVLVGSEWLNVDKIVRIQVVAGSGNSLTLTVVFSSGGSMKLHGEAAQQLLTYLGKHRAD
jgi:hypothetical protein